MVDAVNFMKHWRESCKDQENCKGCFVEHECQLMTDRRSDKAIMAMILKIEKRYWRQHGNNATKD